MAQIGGTGQAELGRDELVGAAARSVLVGDCHHHHLFRSIFLRYRLYVTPHLLRRSGYPTALAIVETLFALLLGEEFQRRLDGRHTDQRALEE